MDSFHKGIPQARLDALKDAATINKAQPIDWQKTLLEQCGTRMDAADSLFVARQLELIRAGIYEIQYPALKAKQFVPFDTSTPPGVVEATVRAIDKNGTPKWIRGKAKDIPNVEMEVVSGTLPFQTFALAYSYTQQEIESARYAGVPLQTMKAMAVREILAMWLDRFALVGDAVATSTDSYIAQGSGVTGFFKQTGTLTYTPTTDGTGGSKTFSTKASDSIIGDMGQILTKPTTSSLGVELVDTCILPLSVNNFLMEKRVGDGTSDMVLNFLKKNNPDITFAWSAYLEQMGASNTTRAVAYRNDPGVLQMWVSQEFEQAPPQFDGLSVETICTMRTAGVALFRPNAVVFSDGI